MHAFLKTDDIYKPLQLLEKPCYPLETTYLVFHNITSIQSPITTNRTDVTLYGVQPGGTYTVEITVQFREGEPKKLLSVRLMLPKYNKICFIYMQAGIPSAISYYNDSSLTTVHVSSSETCSFTSCTVTTIMACYTPAPSNTSMCMS